MKYEKIIIAVAVLTFVFSAGLAGASAKSKDSLGGAESSDPKVVKILESFEKKDYESWLSLVNPNSKTAQSISQEDFDKFISMRESIRSGEYDRGLKIYDELGIKLGLKRE